MTDSKMLQAVANSIALMRKEMKDGFKEMKDEMGKGFKDVNERLDMQGKSLAYLEDDAPTREEHRKLKKRVKRLEDKVFEVV